MHMANLRTKGKVKFGTSICLSICFYFFSLVSIGIYLYRAYFLIFVQAAKTRMEENRCLRLCLIMALEKLDAGSVRVRWPKEAGVQKRAVWDPKTGGEGGMASQGLDHVASNLRNCGSSTGNQGLLSPNSLNRETGGGVLMVLFPLAVGKTRNVE